MQVGEITIILEGAYRALNERFFNGELPEIMITVQSSPRAYGSFTTWDSWHDSENGYKEINIGAETLNRSMVETCATMLHEMTHFYCNINGIKDTSRSGTYHNARFKEVAEKHGIMIGYDPRIGYSPTSPTMELFEFVQEQGWQDIELSRNNGVFIGVGGSAGTAGGKDGTDGEGGERKKKSNQRKYQCPNCKCSCRATKPIRIKCLDCDEEMIEVKKEEK